MLNKKLATSCALDISFAIDRYLRTYTEGGALINNIRWTYIQRTQKFLKYILKDYTAGACAAALSIVYDVYV